MRELIGTDGLAKMVPTNGGAVEGYRSQSLSSYFQSDRRSYLGVRECQRDPLPVGVP